MERSDFSGLGRCSSTARSSGHPSSATPRGWSTPAPAIMRKHGVEVEVLRAVDHDIATGVYPDMREHGWATDEWPELYPRVLASDILVVAGPIWLGDNSSVTKQVIERLYALSQRLNDKGQYLFYGRVGRLPDHRQRGRHQALRAERPLHPPAHRLHDPAAGRRRLDRRGRPRAVVPRPGQRRPGERLHQPQHHVHDLEPDAPRQDAQGRRRRPGYGNQRTEWDAGTRFDCENPEYR